MKYMLLVYLDEKRWLAMTPEEQARAMSECDPHIQRLLPTGKLIAGAPLHPTTTATTIRYRDGKRLITDGPFAETREQLGGYTLVEATDLDDALAIAAGFVGTSDMTTIEVRPIVELAPNAPGGGVPTVPER